MEKIRIEEKATKSKEIRELQRQRKKLKDESKK